MTDPDLPERLAGQFASGDDRGDVWGAFDLLLPTDHYLNLGYSGPLQSHLVGSPQRRLVDRVADELRAVRPGDGADGPILDVGCGRGGPAARIAAGRGTSVVGVDLLFENVRRAREQSVDGDGSLSFVVGDASRLPFSSGVFAACLSIDALVYVPEAAPLLSEIARVLDDDGVCVVTDLVAAPAADVDRATLERFGEAWGMPPPRSPAAYRAALDDAGLRVRRETDLTACSVGRFRTWTTLYLAVVDGPLEPLASRALRWGGLDPETVTRQVRAAHEALPALRHALLVVEPTDG